MAEPAADYHRGEMEITEQRSTFHAFIGLTKWGSLAIAVGLIFFTILFCTKLGFVHAAGAAIIVLIVGSLLLKEKKSPAGH